MIYGTRWVTCYGERDDGTWLRGLQGLTPKEIGIGLSSLEKQENFDNWPPTLNGFKRFCKDCVAACAAHRPYLGFDPKRSSPEVVKTNIAEMFTILKGNAKGA